MYFKVIVLCLAIQSIVAYRLDNRLNTDTNTVNHVVLGNADITNAGKHILAKITEARQAKYSNLRVVNMDRAEAVKHVDQIIKLFLEQTNNFESQPCLRIEENLMGRNVDDNCYAQINIIFSIPGKHEVIIGEKAFMIANAIRDDEIRFEFFLGPLYFGVYTTKP